jgi:hypothetical protein
MEHGETPRISDGLKAALAYQTKPTGRETVGVEQDFVGSLSSQVSFVEAPIRILVWQRCHRKDREKQTGQDKTEEDSADDPAYTLRQKPQINRLTGQLDGGCLQNGKCYNKKKRKGKRLRPGYERRETADKDICQDLEIPKRN